MYVLAINTHVLVTLTTLGALVTREVTAGCSVTSDVELGLYTYMWVLIPVH